MSWIEKIRQKPQEQKIRLVWITAIAAAVMLVFLWVATDKISKKLSWGRLFNNAGKNISDEKSFYRQDLDNNGVKIQDRFHWFR